ncbi:MtrB/PioB family decaheme-associated outer membrane protein [Rhodopseudomonas sp. HC1]|uniref:MtrB/PioB family decaheme-associated outer membrane protein n=1 Tax=Rhodopseudomonas infernalis TaxID=2897386 RepID=UPI001EE96864|nr:MtrB/PioB family decaheme-associated outer membrane protein [Rhodopseudomonas infernalis]MCG6206507.1 MtrB/PioB family decaheme-associated outer membrane protein [Rhodopseudomonas infernalis]
MRIGHGHSWLLTPAWIVAATAVSWSARAEEAAPAPGLAEEHGGVVYSGEFDVGYRAFVVRPPHSAFPWVRPGSPANINRNNISKFEEYGRVPPGPYAEYLRVNLQTRDGTYESELRADNIGNNNQRFIFDATKAGEHYLTVMWDQIPHLYNTSAQSIWNGVGTNNLTTSVRIPGSTATANAVGIARMNAALAGRFNTIDVGIQRNKGAVAYRWTPDPNWDVRVAYSNEKREGTQIAGVAIGNLPATSIQHLQAPRPINDTTQIAKLGTQYFGATPWGGRYNVNLAGGASLYQNEYSSYTLENPFYDNSTAANRASFPQYARISLMPSNEAYNSTVTSGIDLPWKSRWNSTVQYTTMRQNDPFIPFTSNVNVYLPNGMPAFTTASLPASSLHGEVNTLLYNTNLTSQLGQDVRTTFRYRYYDNDNQTPELLLPRYVVEDSSQTLAGGLYRDGGSGRRSLAYSYTKQNVSEEAQWRPAKWATLGATAGWERWDRTRREANVTNEYLGRLTGDFKVDDWATLRSSVQYSERRYDNYDALSLARYVWYDPTNTTNGQGVTNINLRKFDLANRNQTKANVFLDLTPFSDTPLSGLTMSPTGGLRFESYPDDPNFFGLRKSNTWNAGIDSTYLFQDGSSITASYLHEIYDRSLVGGNQTTATILGTITAPPLNMYTSQTYEKVDTVIIAANIALIPGKLDMKTSYAVSVSNEDWNFAPYGSAPVPLCGGVACSGYPTVTTRFQRLDGSLKYTVDPTAVTQIGWSGEMFIKLRYIWENNRVSNWQQDLASPYLYLVDSGIARAISMGATNPNYNAQFVQLSLNARW